jgi:hypothetical protein
MAIKLSFRDPSTNVFKAWGYVEENAPGDISREESDDFNLQPGNANSSTGSGSLIRPRDWSPGVAPLRWRRSPGLAFKPPEREHGATSRSGAGRHDCLDSPLA